MISSAAKSTGPSKLASATRPGSGPPRPAGGVQRGGGALGASKPGQQGARPTGGNTAGASVALAQKDEQIEEMDKQVS